MLYSLKYSGITNTFNYGDRSAFTILLSLPTDIDLPLDYSSKGHELILNAIVNAFRDDNWEAIIALYPALSVTEVKNGISVEVNAKNSYFGQRLLRVYIRGTRAAFTKALKKTPDWALNERLKHICFSSFSF